METDRERERERERLRMMVTNAGIASLISSHSISCTDFIMRAPTRISGGPIAHAGMDASNGVKKKDIKK